MRSALGKGLGALISEEAVASVAASTAPTTKPSVSALPISQIKPNPKQPRRQFPQDAMQELTNSIKEHGVLQPILVTAHAGGTYEIIAGERRWRAAQQAGLTEIPAIVRTGSESEHFQTALIENIQREDLNAIDLALGYKRLQDEFAMTQETIAQVVGKDRAVVANTLRLLNLAEPIQQAVKDGKISPGHARALAALSDAAEQQALFERILSDDLTVRVIEQEVRARKKSATPEHVRTAGYETKSPDVRALEEELQRALGRKVEVHSPTGTKGWLKLEFYSLDDFDRLIAQLRNAK